MKLFQFRPMMGIGKEYTPHDGRQVTGRSAIIGPLLFPTSQLDMG
jgi:hypothetical protein